MIASALTIMVGCAIVPAMPLIGKYYNLGENAGWLVTMPALGVVAFSILSGKIIGKIGSYKAMIIGLIAYGTLGFLGSVMPNVIILLIDRFLLGAATVVIMASSTDLIANFYDKNKRMKMLAIQGMSIEFGGVVFLSVSGLLSNISWRYSYYIYLVAFVALLLILFFVPKVEGKKQTLTNKKTKLTMETYIYALITTFIGMLVFFSAIVALPIHLQNNLNFSTSFTGYFLSFVSFIAIVFAGLMPKIVEIFSIKIDLVIGNICYFIAHLIFTINNSTLLLFVGAVFLGIGFGITHALYNSIIVEKSSEDNRGLVLSLFSMATFLGQFLSSFLISIFSVKYAFIVAGIFAIINAMVVWYRIKTS